MKYTEHIKTTLEKHKIYKLNDSNIPKAAEELELSNAGIRVYEVMLKYSDNTGLVSIPWSVVSKHGRMSKSTFGKGKADLTEKGVLKMIKKGGAWITVLVNGVPHTIKEGSTYQLECIVKKCCEGQMSTDDITSSVQMSTDVGTKEYANNTVSISYSYKDKKKRITLDNMKEKLKEIIYKYGLSRDYKFTKEGVLCLDMEEFCFIKSLDTREKQEAFLKEFNNKLENQAQAKHTGSRLDASPCVDIHLTDSLTDSATKPPIPVYSARTPSPKRDDWVMSRAFKWDKIVSAWNIPEEVKKEIIQEMNYHPMALRFSKFQVICRRLKEYHYDWWFKETGTWYPNYMTVIHDRFICNGLLDFENEHWRKIERYCQPLEWK